jgi:hypothetical protein
MIIGASPAYAQWWHPYNPYNHEPYRTETRERVQGWMPLATHYTTESERQDIVLGPDSARFHRIRLEATEGRPKITRVVLEFGSGPKQYRTRQIVNLYRPLEGYNRVKDIEVNGGDRQINRIIVYADPRFGGEYSVFGT